MSNDSSIQDERLQRNIPPDSEPDTDEPTVDPDAPGNIDPLARPDVVTQDLPEDWPDSDDSPDDGEEAPPPDDRP